jgi:hypothetical protein
MEIEIIWFCINAKEDINREKTKHNQKDDINYQIEFFRNPEGSDLGSK